jgi:hypothetical protein
LKDERWARTGLVQTLVVDEVEQRENAKSKPERDDGGHENSPEIAPA